MTGILAIETATEACSVAVFVQGQFRERHEIAPRQHSQLLFRMLGELLPPGDIRQQGIEAIAYGSGPGSFTGLRIAASAVQGLAYTCDLPVVPVSTLAALAQSALRNGHAGAQDRVLAILDARINEVYSAVYAFRDGLAVLEQGPWACAPVDLAPVEEHTLCAVGNGCEFFSQFSENLQQRIVSQHTGLLPSARDLVPLAQAAIARNEVQSASQVQPVYVRDEISWKKLSEQGRSV